MTTQLVDASTTAMAGKLKALEIAALTALNLIKICRKLFALDSRGNAHPQPDANIVAPPQRGRDRRR